MTEATDAAAPANTSIVMVLDRSGSMDVCRDATIKSVNSYLKEAKGDDNLKDADFELMIFDSMSIDTIRSGAISTIADISRADFEPRAGTPLLDAIGRGVDSLDKKAGDGKAILVIVTDGEENQSRKHSYESIKALLGTRQDKGWLVIFLGAGLDSARQGLSMGISANNVANIAMDEVSLAATASFVATSNAAYASTRSMDEAKGYAGSVKMQPRMRMMMGDKSGGAGIVDPNDPQDVNGNAVAQVLNGAKPLKIVDDPWAKKVVKPVDRDAFDKVPEDAWAK
jgi:hypothetical protein